MTVIRLGAPLAGWVCGLDEVPDPVFAGRMMGDGIAIDPVEGMVHAPCDAVVIAVAPTLHSVTLRVGSAELLIHVGLETVGLNGTGFVAHVAAGDRVAAGDALLGFDLDIVARLAKSLVTPIIVTSEGATLRVLARDRLVAFGAPILELTVADEQIIEAADGREAVRSLVVTLPNGLHARPAARLAAMLKAHAARATFEANDRSADGRSMVAIMALGVRHGDGLTIRATGPDAAAAVAALVALIETGMGEAPAAVSETALPAPAAGSILTGVRASPGLAIGIAARLVEAVIDVPHDGSDAAADRAALDAALISLGTALAQISGSHREIAAAHQALLADPMLHDAAAEHIGRGRSAAMAWRLASEAAADDLRATGDALLIERIADLTDLERRLAVVLHPELAAAAMVLPSSAILIAEELMPSQFMALDLDRLAGIATMRGGPTSHVAILAAAAGVPMLVAVAGLEDVPEGRTLILDADAGRLDTDPGTAALANAGARRAAATRRHISERAAAPNDCRMADGTRIEVFANLSSVDEAARAVAAGAEGCGLLRTEFLFTSRAAAPGEDEQAAAYAAIAATLGDRPLIVRTLDIGGDKPVAYLPFPPEDNPALGARGVRFSLARPDLLDIQLRAILRGVPGAQCRIMVPMVVEPSELVAVSAALDRAMVATGRVDRPQLGVMIETPAAALLAGPIAEVADFLSVGSNDLTQYALACDRGNPATAARIDALHPAVLRLIGLAAEGAAAHGRWLGVCGGVASEPAAAAILIGLGVTEFSASPAAIPAVKAAVRGLDLAACRALAARALACSSAAEVRALIEGTA